MELTGKAKEEFEKWYDEKHGTCNNLLCYNSLYDLPKSMQWGVYQDWADILGYDMVTQASIEQDKYWFSLWHQDEQYEHFNEEYFTTREQVRNAAVEKLNELINNN
tara:strand:+ start:18 stop:335 length:318 start_codon:yes stop_codon:yes gene_type:complete